MFCSDRASNVRTAVRLAVSLTLVGATVLLPSGPVAGRPVPAPFPVHEYIGFPLPSIGGMDTHVEDINDKGEAVGWGESADGATHAVLWRNGKAVDLGTPGGGSSWAFGINNNSQIVGSTETAEGINVPFLWQEGTMMVLPLRPGYTGGIAYDLNDAGTIVGSLHTAPNSRQSVRWDPGDAEIAPPSILFGGTAALALNEAGVAVGMGEPYGAYASNRGMIWRPGDHPIILDPQGSLWGQIAYDVNEAGVVVGKGNTRSFRWINGVLEDPFRNSSGSEAHAINDAGTIVGKEWYRDGVNSYPRAYVQKGDFAAHLNAIAYPHGKGSYGDAVGINNHRQIAVNTDWSLAGYVQAYLVSPTTSADIGLRWGLYNSWRAGKVYRVNPEFRVGNLSAEQLPKFHIEIWLSDDPVFDAGDKRVRKLVVPPIKPKSERVLRFRYATRKPLVDHFLFAVIDSTNRVPEGDESNNVVRSDQLQF